MTYKIGQIHTAKYVGKSPQYQLGQRVDIFDDETHIKVAAFVVERTNELEASGKIINTYGHKRRNQKP